MSVESRLLPSIDGYEGEVSDMHMGAIETTAKQQAISGNKDYLSQGISVFPDDFTHSLEGLHYWGKQVVKSLPAGIDLAHDVDDEGQTGRGFEPAMFSQWTLADGIGAYFRLSEARTAWHSSGLLRTPIRVGGIALEATREPDSDDIRQFQTLCVLEPEKNASFYHPWALPSPVRVYDLTSDTVHPPIAGDLSERYPAQVELDREQEIIELGLNVIKYLIIK